MDSITCVEQKGIIESINSGIATINITAASACASCQANGSCGMSEEAEKQFKVAVNKDEYQKGDTVNIIMKKSLGYRAILLAYVLPFILVIFSLILLISLGLSEAISGLISIGALIIYFFILHANKNKLNKTFQFTLNKVN